MKPKTRFMLISISTECVVPERSMEDADLEDGSHSLYGS